MRMKRSCNKYRVNYFAWSVQKKIVNTYIRRDTYDKQILSRDDVWVIKEDSTLRI